MGVKKQDLLELFRSSPDKKFTFEDIVKAFRVGTKPRKKLMPYIQSLMNTGDIFRDIDGRYKLSKDKKVKPQVSTVPQRGRNAKPAVTAIGKFIKNQAGFGFVATAEDFDDVYLDKQQVEWNGLMNGDVVKVRVDYNPRQRKYSGTFIEFVSRRDSTVMGRLIQHHGGFAVQVRGTNEVIAIQHGQVKRARTDDWVEVEIKKHSSGRAPAMGEVKKIVDDDDYIVIKELGLRDEFEQKTIDEAEKIKEPEQNDSFYDAENIMDDRNNKRINQSKLNFVTIDGEDAKDFDDAVFYRKTEDGHKLYVAIADVSHYVLQGSVIDAEAYERTTSVYFPDRAIPMLPAKLSENICSLKPDRYRYVFTFEIRFDEKGNVRNSKLYSSVIKSKARLTYTAVQKVLDPKFKAPLGMEPNLDNVTPEIKEMLQGMYTLYKLLRNKSKARGTIFMNIPEAQIIINDDGSIKNIVERPVWDSHSLIEEFMIAANIEAAKRMKAQNLGVYRVHEQPDPDKLKSYAETARLYKIAFDPLWKHAQDFSKFLDGLKDNPAKGLLNKLFLRSLRKAQYSNLPQGHFALALLDYTHFTSPIRRYPDLIVHRLLKNANSYTDDKVKVASDHCSDGELKSQAAERSIVKIKQARYLENKIGEEFVGEFCGFNDYGAFVQLKDIFIEGYLPFSNMGHELLVFDEPKMALTGKQGKVRYRLGDDIKVYVASVDVFEGRIEFSL